MFARLFPKSLELFVGQEDSTALLFKDFSQLRERYVNRLLAYRWLGFSLLVFSLLGFSLLGFRFAITGFILCSQRSEQCKRKEQCQSAWPNMEFHTVFPIVAAKVGLARCSDLAVGAP